MLQMQQERKKGGRKEKERRKEGGRKKGRKEQGREGERKMPQLRLKNVCLDPRGF